MTEVFFYHMTRRVVDEVLPPLLEKTLEKGWRAVVEGPDRERLEALDTRLWTYKEDSFLPHGLAGDPHLGGHEEAQPILLTDTKTNPNSADLRFLVDGAELDQSEAGAYQRVIYLFDGRDEERVASARKYWKTLKDAGHDVTYWQESDAGRWEKKA